MPLPNTTIKSKSFTVEYRDWSTSATIDIYGIREGWMSLLVQKLTSESELREIASHAIATEIASMLHSFETISGKPYHQFVEDLGDSIGIS